jgi:hypothetical protein
MHGSAIHTSAADFHCGHQMAALQARNSSLEVLTARGQHHMKIERDYRLNT